MSTSEDKALADAYRLVRDDVIRRGAHIWLNTERIEKRINQLDPPVPEYTDGLYTGRDGSYWVRRFDQLEPYLWRSPDHVPRESDQEVHEVWGPLTRVRVLAKDEVPVKRVSATRVVTESQVADPAWWSDRGCGATPVDELICNYAEGLAEVQSGSSA